MPSTLDNMIDKDQSSYVRDREYLARAIELAKKGLYTTGANPRVGCVLVKDDQIIAEGWHQVAGQAHAEVDALSKLDNTEQAKGATAYVSLEPCSHQGKTGPCANALIDAGVKRVVCAMTDPAPHVAGQGLQKLREAGIDVTTDLAVNEAQALNPGFIKRMKKSLPYVRVKMAMSLDGRTAMASGESKWITGESARLDVQQWRARSQAIVTGIKTVQQDNPSMNIRPHSDWFRSWPSSVALKHPLRVALDSQFQLSAMSHFVQGDGASLVVGTKERDTSSLNQAGAETMVLAEAENGFGVDLKALLVELAKREINEVWVEAGATLAASFIQAKLVDELIIYTAPTLLGSKAKPAFDLPFDKMSEQVGLELKESRMLGKDTRLIYQIQN